MKKRGLVSPGTNLSSSNIYRLLHQEGLMKPQGITAIDRRKFEAELPNDLWQSDVMHGPMVEVGDRRRKSYLISFIDDHSRLVPHGEFYLSEALGFYLDAFEKALLKRGLPRKLYVDNGPAFRSNHLEHITATIGIALIHSRPYKPQGKGKVERFYRTVRGEFLNYFQGKTLRELNEAFDLWLQDVYHQRKHSSTGQSPFDRFTSHMECIRPAPANLKDYFRKAALRRVGKDRTITLNGRLYEAPVPLIGKRVTLLFHENQIDKVDSCTGQYTCKL
jgi:transposase InsO family protein